MSLEKAKYMPGIDGLRTLAVFAVVFYHLNFPFMPGGFLGVTLFFVLSGYLITDLLLNEWTINGKISLSNFWKRRAKRLLPGLFTLLLLLGAFVTLFRPDLMQRFIPDLIPAILYYSNWWNIFYQVSYFQSFEAQPLLNHLWSLAVEEQFYIFWPILTLIGLKLFNKHKKIIVGIILLGALTSSFFMALLYNPDDPSRAYFGTDTRIFSLLLGAAAAFIFPSVRLKAMQLKGLRLFALNFSGLLGLGAFLAFNIFTSQYDDFLYNGGMLLFSFCCVLLILSVVNQNTFVSKVFGVPPLRWVGKFSYEIYLFQFPLIVLSTPTVNTVGINWGLSVLQIAGTMFLAWMVYFFIGNPIRYRKSEYKPNRVFTVLKYAAILLLLGVTAFGIFRPAQPDYTALAKDTGVPSPSTKVITPSPRKTPMPQKTARPKKTSVPVRTPMPSKTSNEVISTRKITVIGDSVMINIVPYLEDLYPNMDFYAKVGFQIHELQDMISSLRKQHKLFDFVIIELGTNGPCSKSRLIEIIDGLGPECKIIFCSTRSPRSWVSDFNRKLDEVITKYPNTFLADWYAVSANHDEYFARDGVHPTRSGCVAYKEMLQNAIQLVLQKDI